MIVQTFFYSARMRVLFLCGTFLCSAALSCSGDADGGIRHILSSSALDQIQLPRIISGGEFFPGVLVSIRGDRIYVGRETAALYSDLKRPASYGGRGLVVPLHSSLYKARQQWTSLISGTVKHSKETPLIGYQPRKDMDIKTLEQYTNPPLLIAAPSHTPLSHIIAIAATAQHAGYKEVKILVQNRSNGRLAQEPLFLGDIPANSSGLVMKADIQPLQIVLSDEKGILAGPSGKTGDIIKRRATGMIDTDTFLKKIREIKKQFPSADYAYVSGKATLDLRSFIEVVGIMRCTRADDGRCQNSLFSKVGIAPQNFRDYQLGPILIPGVQ